jgi:Holliday junction resolvasome RuvABC endonuclease subunit
LRNVGRSAGNEYYGDLRLELRKLQQVDRIDARSMTHFIGIDQSLTGTGGTILSEDGKIVDTILVSTKKMVGVRRLSHICREIRRFMSQVSGEIYTVREEYSFCSKGRAIFNLGELGGCVDLSMYEECRPGKPHHSHYRIPPGVHKKFCIDDGSANKGKVKADKLAYLALIEQHTGEHFDDDNIADSYMLARTLWGFWRIMKDEDYFLTLDREKKNVLVPPKIRKKKNLTPAKVGKLEYDVYKRVMSDSFTETYRLFEKGVI